MKKDAKSIQSHSNSKATEKGRILLHHSDLSVGTNKMATRPQQQAVMPQRPGLVVDLRKSAASLPRLAFDFRNLPSHSQELKRTMQNKNKKQLPEDPVKYSGINEMQWPLDGIIFHAERSDHSQPNFDCMNNHQLPTYKYPYTKQMNGLSERSNHRQPLKSINQSRPTNLPPRHGRLKQQLCRHYAQGRCYFGDNCKFLHERR